MHTTTATRPAAKAAVLASFLTGTFCVGGIAGAAEPTTDELLSQIEALQAKVEQIQAAEQARDAVAPEGDAVEAALADAKARSAQPLLMQFADDPDPFTAGHNGKFLLQSPDGRFSLNPNFQLQIRHVANFAPEGGDEFEDLDFGWELRRTKIGFKGNAFSEDLTYDIKFAFDRSGGEAILENGFVDYAPGRFGLRIGQYKDPLFYEESTSSSKQMAADRSMVNESLGGGITGFVQGAGLIFKGEKFTGLLAYIDGTDTANTNFEDAGELRDAVSFRGDFTLAGNDEAFDDFTALGTDETSARFGFGALLDAVELDDDGDDDFAYVILATADFGLETTAGDSLFFAGYFNYADNGDDDFANFGAEAQYAKVLDADAGWEIFGRYNFVLLDEEIALGEGASEDFFHEVTVGVNKYWESHKVKMTVDVSYLFNGTPGGVGSGLGYRPQTGDEGQATIRGQFQLLL